VDDTQVSHFRLARTHELIVTCSELNLEVLVPRLLMNTILDFGDLTTAAVGRLNSNLEAVLQQHKHDAYHSLSIEGYGRFILNLMLVSGGIPEHYRTENRPRYMQVLEAASSDGDIAPFIEFVLSELKFWSVRSATS
jgi:hypothetical protein